MKTGTSTVRPPIFRISTGVLKGAAPRSLHLHDASEHAVPGRPVGADTRRGGLFVADHLLLLGVPTNRTAEPERHVGQVTGGGDSMTVLHLAQRAFAAPHRARQIALFHGHVFFAAGAVAWVRLDPAAGRLDPRRPFGVRID